VPNAPATVLVVEDEETICEIVVRFMEDDGVICVTAHSGEAALEWLHPISPGQISSLSMCGCQA
jgi:DNA-binding response OmpR family regulator